MVRVSTGRCAPIVRLRVVLALDEPALEVVARAWAVVVEHAIEAKAVLVQAPHAKLPLARLDRRLGLGLGLGLGC